MIPKDALVLGGPSPTVFVVDTTGNSKTGEVRPVPVSIGASDGRLVEIQGAVKAGEMVVVRGNERLRPKQGVTITEILDPHAAPEAQALGR